MTEGWSGGIASGIAGEITDDDGNLLLASENDPATADYRSLGFGPAPTGFIQRGLYNGDFALTPLASPDGDINNENPLPYWTVANPNASAMTSVADAAAPSGRALLFRADTSAPNVSILQTVRLHTVADGQMLIIPTAVVVAGATVSANTTVQFQAQYDVGSSSTLSLTTAAIGASTQQTMRVTPNTTGAVPATAKLLKLEFDMIATGGATSAETLSLYEIRLEVYRLAVDTKVITVAGDTIPCTSPTVKVSNGTAGSITLTSAPTIPNGVDGQRLLVRSVGAQNVVIQDQGTLASSNLRLSAATITLGTRDSIMLEYDSTIGDWCQIGQVNVL